MRQDLEKQLRDAASSGEFPKALALWEAFAKQLAREIEQGKIGADDMAAAAGLVAWVTRVAQAARAQAEEQLRESRESARASRAYSDGERRGPAVLRKTV